MEFFCNGNAISQIKIYRLEINEARNFYKRCIKISDNCLKIIAEEKQTVDRIAIWLRKYCQQMIHLQRQ
jgi:hypothetical protein